MIKPIGVYIHIPFCRKRCAYCDFYSATLHTEVCEKYVSRLESEIYRWGDKLNRPADTVYFGGGTPSVLGAKALNKLLNAAKKAFKVKNDAEITIEINPEDATEEFLTGLKNGGFNRLSLGIQTLNNKHLKILGRRHSAENSVTAFKNARKAGFNNISVDIMIGLPNQSVEEALNDTEEIVRLSPEHISCYMLILEDKTALYALRDKFDFPSEEAVSEEYLKICGILSRYGYNHYEISNFAKKNKESIHNLKYWQLKEYIGIGPSAYSFIDKKRFHTENNLKSFINAPETVFDSNDGDIYEYIMLALRIKNGINEKTLISDFSKKYSKEFYIKAKQLCDNGLAMFNGNNLSLTDKGMLVSNSIICEMTQEELYENI